MTIPVWITPPGSLGTIPEGVFYSIPLLAESNETVYYRVVAGSLPPGIFINETGILSGLPQAKASVTGIPLPVEVDVTSKFAIRAYTATNQLADRTFTLTVSALNTISWVTPAGNIGRYFDGNQITGLQLQYNNLDPFAASVVTLVGGQLPPGLTISSTGLISGYIIPNTTDALADTNYQFTLKVTNGQASDIRTFSIYVYALNSMTADNTFITADTTYITADASPPIPPIITTPTGSIGSTRSDNFFSFRFTGVDFNFNQLQFISNTTPPGLTLDPTSGWLYGYIPALGISSQTYSFIVSAYELNNPSVISKPYEYSLTITGPVSSDITWLTPSNLGTIDNGATSSFYVKAVNASGLALTYQLLSGSDSRLPQGLELLPTGNIAGRVSFDTFALDGGTTMFDSRETTFDMVCTFTVNATSTNGLVNSSATFSIRVIRRYEEPYDNLYIQAMPPQAGRDLLSSLVQNNTIFPPELIYRADDPNFGVSKRIVYPHAYGLTAATYDDYVNSLELNHYWKDLVLGEIKTAQALDDSGNIIYEVVYSEVVDNLVNNNAQSVGKEVNLPFTLPPDIQTVYPNSLVDMRTQVIDVVGQVSNVLPRWMLSKQSNGNVLGFTPAWVIAYTKPGESGQIAYNIKTSFGDKLNLIDFEVDRYELDNLLTKNWNRENKHWGYSGNELIPYPPTLTTFDFIGLPGFDSTKAYNVGEVVEYQTTDRGYVVVKLYVCIQATTPGILPTNTNYWSDNGNSLASWINDSEVITTWEDNLFTVATWTYATPPGTTFDGGSLQFTAPVDMYSNSNEYDKYLVFPKRNILG